MLNGLNVLDLFHEPYIEVVFGAKQYLPINSHECHIPLRAQAGYGAERCQDMAESQTFEEVSWALGDTWNDKNYSKNLDLLKCPQIWNI